MTFDCCCLVCRGDCSGGLCVSCSCGRCCHGHQISQRLPPSCFRLELHQNRVCGRTELESKNLLFAVATGFPAGQTPLETRVEEVVQAVADGASEIDIVINRKLALTGQWEGTNADGFGESSCSPC